VRLQTTKLNKNQSTSDQLVVRPAPEGGGGGGGDKAERAGAGGLARAFGRTGTDTHDVFNLIQVRMHFCKYGCTNLHLYESTYIYKYIYIYVNTYVYMYVQI